MWVTRCGEAAVLRLHVAHEKINNDHHDRQKSPELFFLFLPQLAFDSLPTFTHTFQKGAGGLHRVRSWGSL